MDSPTVCMIVLTCTFGGALLGMYLGSVLPEHHLADKTKETVTVGIALVATMTALVLGLVTASAKNSFDAVDSAVKKTAVDILSLDRVLARYGPETAEIRNDLKSAVGTRIDQIWPQGSTKPAKFDPLPSGTMSASEKISDVIRALKPRDDSQKALQSQAVDLTETLLKERWLSLAGTETSIPLPFIVILVFWLTITFTSFGLFAPRNATVIVVLLVCALSVSSAVFLVLEMDTPFVGFIKVSADPLRYAYTHLNY